MPVLQGLGAAIFMFILAVSFSKTMNKIVNN